MASQLALLFMNHIVCLHGLPETIVSVSDRDPKFTSLFWTEIHRLLGIKLAKSTAFHLQTNGASESMIRKMSQVLRTVVRPDQLDWPKHLPMTEFTINSSMSASTGFAPFELTYGYLPRESPHSLEYRTLLTTRGTWSFVPTTRLSLHVLIKPTKPTNGGEVMTLYWR
jgi:hypothetical protein